MRLSHESCDWKLIGFSLAVLSALTWGTSIGRAGESEFRVFDRFDEKFELNWEPVRPDPTHVSLTKNPGKLTITTQGGGVYGSVGPSAKNFYLIRNPVAEGGDFVLTTCIESFKPTANWQQAGLLVYDDDDNYLKCDIEWNGSAVQLKFIRETDGEPINETDRSGVEQERIWIRLIKRGKTYERAYSTDGNKFVSAGERDWGNGNPEWIGILAKNGPTGAGDIDAVFDFFEARSLTDAEKSNPVYVERQKLEGTWEVISCMLNGKSLENTSFSQFVFDGASVTVKEKTQSIKTEFTLDVTREPKRLALSALSRQAKRPANGVYSLEGETLVICLALEPNAPAPTELETKEGDSRLLITLRCTSEKEAADARPVR